jgi:hypothetical protein
MLVVQNAEAPTEEEASSYLKALGRYITGTKAPRVLVVTEGGAPGPALRQRIDRIVRPHKEKTRVAIVTGATFARGVLLAIQAINPIYQGFSPDDLDGALRYLEIPAFHAGHVLRHINELRAELGLPPVK